MFVLPLLRENKTPGCPIQRVLENDFVVVTGTGTARDFIRLLPTVRNEEAGGSNPLSSTIFQKRPRACQTVPTAARSD